MEPTEIDALPGLDEVGVGDPVVRRQLVGQSVGLVFRDGDALLSVLGFDQADQGVPTLDAHGLACGGRHLRQYLVESSWRSGFFGRRSAA